MITLVNLLAWLAQPFKNLLFLPHAVGKMEALIQDFIASRPALEIHK